MARLVSGVPQSMRLLSLAAALLLGAAACSERAATCEDLLSDATQGDASRVAAEAVGVGLASDAQHCTPAPGAFLALEPSTETPRDRASRHVETLEKAGWALSDRRAEREGDEMIAMERDGQKLIFNVWIVDGTFGHIAPTVATAGKAVNDR
jgi:hypothetical protein